MTSATPADEVQAHDPYRALGLLPSAPLDLVVEVYWAQVRRLHKQPASTTDADLERLNAAYAEITNSAGAVSVPVVEAAPVYTSQTTSRPGLLSRLLGRSATYKTQPPDPRQILGVSLTASAEVIEIAYRYARKKHRVRTGIHADDALGKLDAAYESLCGSAPRAAVTTQLDTGQDVANIEADAATSTKPIGRALSNVGRAVGVTAGRFRRTIAKWAANPLFEQVGADGKIQPKPRMKRTEGPPAAVFKPASSMSPTNAAADIRALSDPQPAFVRRGVPTSRSGAPRLVSSDDEEFAIDSRAIVIGTHDDCDLKTNGAGLETLAVNVWSEDGRIVLHAIDGRDAVRVNGVTAEWAFLEDGDQITICDDVFTVRSDEARTAFPSAARPPNTRLQ